MRESTVETAHRKAVKARGGICYKFVSPGRRAVPDRLDLYPIPERYRELVGRYIQFTETKAPGKKPRPEQAREHERIQKLGFVVNVKDQK